MPTINPVSTVSTPDLQGATRNAQINRGAGKHLLQFADTLTKRQMQEVAATNYLKGQQQIAQGKSLQEVKDDQASYTRFFGESATVRGARALDTEVAIDNMHRASVAAIPANAEMNPQDFAKFQQDELAGIVADIDDDTQRAQIAAAYSKKAAEVSGMHLKAHATFVDTQMRQSYVRAVFSKAQNVQESVNTEGEAPASQELSVALSQPQGMGDEQYLSSVAEVTIQTLEGDNGAIYNQLMSSGVIEQMSPEQQTEIYKARKKYEKGQQKEMSLEIAKSMYAVEGIATNPDSSFEDVLGSLTIHKEKYGLTAEKATSMLNKFRTSRKDKEEHEDLNDLARNRQFHNMTPKHKKAALDQMREEFGNNYPEYWASIGVKDETLAKKFTASLSSMVLADGSVDPRFVQAYEEFQQYNKLDSTRAFDHITDDRAKARMQAIISRVAVHGDVSAAIRDRASIEQNQAEGGFTPEQTKEIKKEVKDTVDGTWFGFGKSDLNDAFNSSYVSSVVERGAKDYMVNGHVDAADAAELARRDFENQHDMVKGNFIPNGGTSFKERLGLTGEQTIDEVLDTLIDENRAEMFGAHEGEYTSTFNAGNNSMTFTPIDENGLPVAGGMTLDIDSIKSLNTLKVSKAAELETQAAAARQEQSLDRSIRIKQFQAQQMGQSLTKAQALEVLNKENEALHTMTRSAARGVISAFPKLRALGIAQEKVMDLVVPRASAAEKETGEANAAAADRGVAHKSNTSLGWGLESVKAVGGSNKHVGQMLDVFAMTESSSGRHRANPVSSARGLFQYLTKAQKGGNNAMQTAMVRAARQMQAEGVQQPQWFKDLNNTTFNGDDNSRSEAMIMLDDDKSAALLLWEMKSRPQTRKLLEQVQAGDADAARQLYYKYHHTNPDAGTTRLFEKNFKIIYGD